LPTAASTPIIRGSSSISAGSAPLYVIDGVIGKFRDVAIRGPWTSGVWKQIWG